MDRREILLDTARVGIGFEKLADNTMFCLLLDKIKIDSEQALGRCKTLSPYTQQGEIADALQLANTYDLIIAKISRFIEDGIQAQRELDSPEPFTDE